MERAGRGSPRTGERECARRRAGWVAQVQVVVEGRGVVRQPAHPQHGVPRAQMMTEEARPLAVRQPRLLHDARDGGVSRVAAAQRRAAHHRELHARIACRAISENRLKRHGVYWALLSEANRAQSKPVQPLSGGR